MPYEWVKRYEAPERSGAFAIPGEASAVPEAGPLLAELRLWPHRSLPRVGFVWVIGATAGLLGLPLVAVLGTPVLWGLLPFVVGTVWALWSALKRSYRDGEVTEVLRLWPGRLRLDRRDRRGHREWEANPHWVRVTLHPTGGPVPNYLTLKGAGREVEIGAFLSEDERIALRFDLTRVLSLGR